MWDPFLWDPFSFLGPAGRAVAHYFASAMQSWFNILEYHPLFCFILNVINAFVGIKEIYTCLLIWPLAMILLLRLYVNQMCIQIWECFIMISID